MPGISRRNFLWLAAGATTAAKAQGIASRGVKPQAHRRNSGLPFLARFTDVAQAAGLHAPVIYGGLDHKDFIYETVGCGVAFLDFDNDGWLDIFVLSGTRTPAVPNTTNRLYKNNRDGTFTDVTARAGLTRTGWASAVTVADYNNDGFDDLFITYFGQNVLYRNNGDGTFTDVTEQAGLLYTGKPRWGSGCTFLDFDRDGHLDLFIASYVDVSSHPIPRPGQNGLCRFKDVPVNCGPNGLPMGSNYLFRNQGDGTFKEITASSGLASAGSTYAMTAAAADWNEDGWIDLYVASDSTPSLLFLNQNGRSLKEDGVERGVAFNQDGGEQAGMGVAVGDYNLDGHLDLYKTHFSDDTDVLYRNDGKAMFDDVTTSAHLAEQTRYVRWGTGFADFDNNGWPDLFAVTGSVYPEIEASYPEYPLRSPRLLFRNLGDGTFEDMSTAAGPGLTSPHCSRGCAFGDFDNDGDVDIVVVNLNEAPSLLKNDVTSGCNWIKVLLEGTVSNRSAIGSRVLARYEGRVQAQAVLAQSSFFSVNDRRLHFGVGQATSVDLDIIWPSGKRDHLAALPTRHLVIIREGHGVLRQEKWPDHQIS